MNDPQATLDRLVAKAGRLYSLPAVAMEVLELTDSPKVDAAALRECIENDPALVSKLLRVVNSSLFGLSRQVSDLNQALALLGIKPLKLLVLGFSLPGELFAGVASDALGRYWRHTLTKAVAAREVSETAWHQPGDEAFLAGLLQDLGTLVLIQELGEPYVRFFHRVLTVGGSLIELERQTMGFDHTELSARLLAGWGLPGVLVDAVHPSEERQDSPERSTLGSVVELAELLARFLADGRSELLGELFKRAQEDHGLCPERVETLLASLGEKVRQLADVLSLKLPDGMDYDDLLVKAHAQLALLAEDVAGELLDPGGGSLPAAGQDHDTVADECRALGEALGRMSTPVSQTEVLRSADPITRSPGRAFRHPVSGTARSGGPAAATLDLDPGLEGRLAAAVAACRQRRSSLSLLLVELNDVDTLVFHAGVGGLEQALEKLLAACRGLDLPGATGVAYGEAGLALILPDCDRHPAVRLGTELMARLRQESDGREAGPPAGISVGVGVATVCVPPRNFPAGELLARAERCLYAAHASGGGVVKSIEIY